VRVRSARWGPVGSLLLLLLAPTPVLLLTGVVVARCFLLSWLDVVPAARG
jgi:hypothetical protein